MALAVLAVFVRLWTSGIWACLGSVGLALVGFLGFAAVWGLVKYSLTLLSPPATGVQNGPATPEVKPTDDSF